MVPNYCTMLGFFKSFDALLRNHSGWTSRSMDGLMYGWTLFILRSPSGENLWMMIIYLVLWKTNLQPWTVARLSWILLSMYHLCIPSWCPLTPQLEVTDEGQHQCEGCFPGNVIVYIKLIRKHSEHLSISMGTLFVGNAMISWKICAWLLTACT